MNIFRQSVILPNVIAPFELDIYHFISVEGMLKFVGSSHKSYKILFYSLFDKNAFFIAFFRVCVRVIGLRDM
jgi:hypothetical protein